MVIDNDIKIQVWVINIADQMIYDLLSQSELLLTKEWMIKILSHSHYKILKSHNIKFYPMVPLIFGITFKMPFKMLYSYCKISIMAFTT